MEENGNQLRVEIDEATRGRSGSPNIPQVIAEKIATADALVADVSTINAHDTSPARRVQNPNVLFELGHGLALLGWSRIVLVGNKAFGAFPEDLPFDIDRHAAKSFSLSESDSTEKARVKSESHRLGATFQTCISEIIHGAPVRPATIHHDPQERKRQRDIRTLKGILHHLNPDVIDGHVQRAPKQIRQEVIFFWEAFHGQWSATSTHIYDDDVKGAIDKLHRAWETSLSFSDHYDPVTEAASCFWPSSAAGNKDWETACAAVDDLKRASEDLFGLLRERFVEIDLDEMKSISWATWRSEQGALFEE